MLEEQRNLYEFGEFRLDLRERKLTRLGDSVHVPLTDKAFQTLTVLVKNHRRLVTRDELIEAVWPDSIVEENNLEKAVHAIRHALGEKRTEIRYIETVRKYGYRFVGEVKQVSDENADNDNAEPAVASEPRRLRLFLVFGVALSIIAVFMLASLDLSPAKPRSLFIHPLEKIGPGERDPLLEVGIADALINRFAMVDELIVRPLSSTRAYSAASGEPLEAGRQHRVDYVLASNYQLDGRALRVTAQLINVENGNVERSFTKDFEMKSAFAVQDAVAAEIFADFVRKLGVAATADPTLRGTSNEQAYRMFLEGMLHYDLRNRESVERSVAALTRAVELDPNFSRAWAGKAHAHLSFAGFGRYDHNKHSAAAEEAIQRALALDGRNADAYSALCLQTFTSQHDNIAAEELCRKALRLDPNSSLAHQVYSRMLNAAGRHDEAIAEIKTAIDLEPMSTFNQRLLGVGYFYSRDYDKAITEFERVLNMDRAGPTISWLTQALVSTGREREAYELWMAHLKEATDEDRSVWQRAYEQEGWKGIIRERELRFDDNNDQFLNRAAYNAYIGNADKAFAYLDRSYESREALLPYLKVDPRFDPIRNDPRYTALLKRLGPDQR